MKILFSLFQILTLVRALTKEGASEGLRVESKKCRASIAVASRDSERIVILNADNGKESKKLNMPGSNPDPMYIIAVNGFMYVGDRENSWIAVFTLPKYNLVNVMRAGNGVANMGADAVGKQLWVVNDVDNTITVFDLHQQAAFKTIELPSSVSSGTFYDVTLSPDGAYAFVTTVGTTESWLLKYDTSNFSLVQSRGDLQVSGNAKVAVTYETDYLYLAQQGATDAVSILEQDDITAADVAIVSVPDAHSIGISPYNSAIYVTDSDATDDSLYGIYAIDKTANTLVASFVTLESSSNIVVTPSRVFVTSSVGNEVNIYLTSSDSPSPIFKDSTGIGTQTFGIAYIEADGCVVDELL